ncbi:MAG: hypothetical protein ACLPVF_16660 [Acidimicrobiales bacterium]
MTAAATDAAPNWAMPSAGGPDLAALPAALDHPVLYVVANEYIGPDLPYAVAAELGDLLFPKLAVCLITWGGSAVDAFMAAMAIREQVEPGGLSYVIPAHCKSAGTAMSLSADRIVMGPLGAAGPIEVQVHQTSEFGENQMDSSLAMQDGLEEVREYALSLQCRAFDQIRAATDLDQSEAIRLANNFVGELLKPVIGRISPEILGDRRRTRAVGIALGHRLLATAHSVDEGKHSKVLAALSYNYPTHGFPLRHDELAAIGLNAEPATAEVAAALVRLNSLVLSDQRLVQLVSPDMSDGARSHQVMEVRK